VPARAAITRAPGVMIMLPWWSNATAHGWLSSARLAGPRSPSVPGSPIPATVVIQPVRAFSLRTASLITFAVKPARLKCATPPASVK